MRTGTCLGFFIAASLCVSTLSQGGSHSSQKTLAADGLTPSAHRDGPNGLEGWTLDGPIPDDPGEKYPFTLVIARKGRELHRFPGSAFIWKWMFVDDGRHVAYESGPLHFSMTCVLADLETGKELETYDCYQELPAKAPRWVEALEALQ